MPEPTPETRDAALRPCPFCGSSSDDGTLLPSRRDWRIRCINCDAAVFGSTPEEARANWNRRTPPTEQTPKHP